MRALSRSCLLALALCCVSLASARAQTTPESALAAGDFVHAASLAEAALAAGGSSAASWVALQRTRGVARAHLGESVQAQRAFICALALDPSWRLSNTEVVEVRSPFMEARGFWSQHSQRLTASAELSDDGAALVVALVDPAALVARVLVRARRAGQARFVELSLTPASSILVALETLPAGHDIEYTLALIDENANRLWQLGSDSEPLRQAPPPALQAAQATQPAPAPAPAAAARAAAAPAASAQPYYIGAAVSLAAAAGAAAVAGVSHAERQQLARRWNAGDCDGEGTTRGEVCSHERRQIDHSERLAWGFYALSAAGLVAGIVTLVAAPTKAQRERRAARSSLRALRCQAGPGLVGIGCGAAF
jgi:hypothetical protein